MKYFEIIKEGFHLANKNLAVLLTQVLAGVVMLFFFLLITVIFVAIAIGSVPNLNLQTLSADNLSGLVQTSLTLVALGVLFVIIFMLIAAFITAFVHSGNLGCMLKTARKEARGFTTGEFFASGGRSVWSMLGLYIIWGIVTLFAAFAFGAIGTVGYQAVLSPLMDAGRRVLAFALGVPFILSLLLGGLLFLFLVYAGWTFSAIILVGEGYGASSALGASYRFIKKNFWDALLFALLMFALVFFANIAWNILTMPFHITKDTSPSVAIGLLPVVLFGLLLQMYIGLIARSGFVVFYIDRTTPPAPVNAGLETPSDIISGPENTPESPRDTTMPPQENSTV